MRIQTKVKKLNLVNLNQKIFWSLGAFLLFSSILYVYFVNQTILNIVARENLEGDIVALNSEISEMEFEYISQKNAITLVYAYSLGFKDANNVKFASRKLAGQGLSLRSDQ